MLEFSKIDKDLRIYKENDVFVFGAGKYGNEVRRVLEEYQIPIRGFVDNDINKVGAKINNIKVVSFDECVQYMQTHSNSIIQIGCHCEEEIVAQLRTAGIDRHIGYLEHSVRMNQLRQYEYSRKNPAWKKFFMNFTWERLKYTNNNRIYNYMIHDYHRYNDTINLMLSAPKVGNMTISKSAALAGGSMLHLSQTYMIIDESIRDMLTGYRIKLALGVRDPIGQNLSLLYHMSDESYWDMEEFWDAGGDVKKIFENYIIDRKTAPDDVYFEFFIEKAKYNHLVQNFWDDILKVYFGVDIYNYQFDKENGYSVYHINDKLDILVYQVEKLNQLGNEIGAFWGIDNFEIAISNSGEERWYKDSYKKAVSILPLKKSYFESCYNSQYINHFYSQADIKKLKEKWKSHVEQE